MGGRGARTRESLIATVHVQVAAVEEKIGVVVNLVIARTRQAHGCARVHCAIVAEGMEARGRLKTEDQGAGINHHAQSGVVLIAAKGERARAVLGQRDFGAAEDAIEVDVAGTAHGEAVRSLGKDAGDRRRGGRAAVDNCTLTIDAEANDSERLGNGLTVEVQGGTRADGGGTHGRTEGARVSEAEDVTRVDRGRAGVVIEACQDDRAEGTSCTDIDGVGAREDGVHRQGRAATAEAVTLGARREGSGERIEHRRRDRAEEQRRVEHHRDGLGGITREGQRASGHRGQLVRSYPSSHPSVGTRGDERARTFHGNGSSRGGARRGDFEDT